MYFMCWLAVLILSIAYYIYSDKKDRTPLYKIGDELFYSRTDFPEMDSYITITGIGDSEYQYKWSNGVGKKYTSPIWYINKNYSILPGVKHARKETR